MIKPNKHVITYNILHIIMFINNQNINNQNFINLAWNSFKIRPTLNHIFSNHLAHFQTLFTNINQIMNKTSLKHEPTSSSIKSIMYDQTLRFWESSYLLPCCGSLETLESLPQKLLSSSNSTVNLFSLSTFFLQIQINSSIDDDDEGCFKWLGFGEFFFEKVDGLYEVWQAVSNCLVIHVKFFWFMVMMNGFKRRFEMETWWNYEWWNSKFSDSNSSGFFLLKVVSLFMAMEGSFYRWILGDKTEHKLQTSFPLLSTWLS